MALMVQFSIVSSETLDSSPSGDESERSSIATHGGDHPTLMSLIFSNSIDYAFPEPPPERSREYCEPIPRLCDWLAAHGALIDPLPETANANGQASNGESKSAVGWQSASINALNQERSATPVALNVPSLSITADVAGVGIASDKSMQVPDDYNTVGWYRHGPAPGENGSSVIAGHLDDSRGRSVFYDLQDIETGEVVEIEFDDGTRSTFKVTDKRSYDAGNIPADRIFSRDGDPRLALITCGGRWDSSAGRYTETVVVYAEPV